MTVRERTASRECLALQERLNDYFKESSRVRDIRLDRVKIALKDARYLLLNLSVDSQSYHSDLKVGFGETDDELFEQILKSIKKFIKKLDNKEESSSKSRKRN